MKNKIQPEKLKIVELKAALRAILKMVKHTHKDACGNSCYPDAHYPECVKEKQKIEFAERSLK